MSIKSARPRRSDAGVSHSMDVSHADTLSKRAYPFVFFLLVVFGIITIVLRYFLVTSHHSDLGGVEQNVIYSIQKLLYDGKIYTDPAQAPFSITQYTPIYHYLCAAIAALSGLDPGSDIHGLYVVGRGLNVLINLAMAWTMYLLTNRLLKLPGVLAASLSLVSFICVFRQGFTVRPDSLMDFTMILSVYYFIGYLLDTKHDRNLVIASVLSVLVIFVKQSGIQMPVIFLSFLVFTGNWKGLRIASAGTAVAFAALAGLSQWVFGDVFFKNVIGGVANGVDTSWFIRYVFGSGFKFKVMVPTLVTLAIVLYNWNIFKADMVTRFLCFCALAMLTFAGITVLKSGSNVAYFYAFFLISIVLIARFVYFGTFSPRVRNRLSLAFLLYLTIISTLNVTHSAGQVKDLEYVDKAGLEARENMAAAAANYVKVRLQPGEAVFVNLNDESILSSSYGRRGINNILFRNCLIPQLDIFKSSNVKSGVLGYDRFHEMMSTGKVKYLIESTSTFSFSIIPDLKELKAKHYRLVRKVGAYRIYQFNS